MSNDHRHRPVGSCNSPCTSNNGYAYSNTGPSYIDSGRPHTTNAGYPHHNTGCPQPSYTPHLFGQSAHSGYNSNDQFNHPSFAAATELHVHDGQNGDLFWGRNTLGWVSRDKYYYQSSYRTNPHHRTSPFGQQHSGTSGSAGGQGPKIVHHYRGRYGNEYYGDTAIGRFSEDVHYIPVQDIAVRPQGGTPYEPGTAEARRRKLFEAPTFESVLQVFEDLGFLRAEAKQAMSDCGNDPGHVLEVLMARRKAARSFAQ